MTSVPVASADRPGECPSPRFGAAAAACGQGWLRREPCRACQGGPGLAAPGPAGLGVPLPVPQPIRALPCPGEALPWPHTLRGFPRSCPRAFFARRMRRQRREKICLFFYGRSFVGRPGPGLSPSPRATGPEMASGRRPRGKGHGKKLSPL